MSKFPAFHEIDHALVKYEGIRSLAWGGPKDLIKPEPFEEWLEEVAREYDSYCIMTDRLHLFGDWLDSEDGKLFIKWNDANSELVFHLYSILTQMMWRDNQAKHRRADGEGRSYKSQISTLVTKEYDDVITAIDLPKGYKRDIKDQGGLVGENSATAKVIYIGGFEYICRTQMSWNNDTGAKTVWWDNVGFAEPDGTSHMLTDIGRYNVTASKLKREVTPPEGTGTWMDFARDHLLPIHLKKYGFMQPIDHHMDWVEEHIMGLSKPDSKWVLNTKFIKKKAAEVAERLAFYEKDSMAAMF